MPEQFRDHFSAVSRDYVTFRPSYPPALFAWLASVVPARRRAWDCGAGTGQAAHGLAGYFDHVVASDASRAQLAVATATTRVSLLRSVAERAAIGTASMDLVAVAQALHWFEVDRFFQEARRVLVPGGILAVWTYGSVTTDCEPITGLLREFEHETIGRWWPPQRALVDARYGGVVLPGVELNAPTFSMHAEWTLDQLLGYVATWSGVLRHREATGTDPVVALRHHLRQPWGPQGHIRTINWPLTVRASRVEREVTSPMGEQPFSAS